MTIPEPFNALVVTETGDKQFDRAVVSRRVADLPEGGVTVQVHYSSLNFKDMLSATGNRGVTRNYPHTPGIDASGVVADSTDDRFKPGDEVIVTSYDLGMNTAGGFGQYIRVPADWVVPLPDGLTLRDAMAYGTAGFTAGLSVVELIDGGVGPEAGDVLVSGATGGVGSIAVAILSKIGYPVTAVTGKADQAAWLEALGASAVIGIDEAVDTSGRPLLKSRWAGAVDAVGGDILATAIKSTHPWGVVTCCGNAASPDLPLNVYPFILRGVKLVGIDSQNCPMPLREKTWGKLASEWRVDSLGEMTTEVTLETLNERIDLMQQGKHKGRTIVRMVD